MPVPPQSSRASRAPRALPWIASGALALALVLFWARPWTTARALTPPAPTGAHSEDGARDAHLRDIDSSLADPAQSARSAPARPAAEVAPPSRWALQPAAPTRVARFRVVGRVRVPFGDPTEVTVSAHEGANETLIATRAPVSTRPSSGGGFELDVTDLAPTAQDGTGHRAITIETSHEIYDRASKVTVLRLQPLDSKRADGGGAWRSDQDTEWEFDDVAGTRTLRVDFELRGGALLRGTVVDSKGTPAARVGVGALALDRGVPSGSFARLSKTNDAGDFELRLDPGVDYAVVAARGDTTPATELVPALALRERRRVDLTLEEGLRSVGFLTLGRRNAGEGIAVQLTRVSDGPVLGLGHGQTRVVWDGHSFSQAVLSARTLADGSFRFRGDQAGPWRLQVLALGVPGIRVLAHDAGALQLPSGPLFIGPLFAEVELTLLAPSGGPSTFELRSARAEDTPLTGLRTDERGRVSLCLIPRQRYELVVGDPVATFETGAAGSFQALSFAVAEPSAR